MSNDEKKPAPSTNNKPEPIRVKRILFHSKQIEVPGVSYVGGLTVTEQKHYTIEFMPWLRHHRITWTPPGKEPVVRMVHETHVSTWEPL
ncbi:MAG TPA: hypothetical protein VM580_25990 [Labilithrix sp.]|jgi:hypothetical protein|nr:hypothetical protein [Labilithrix sp.]